MWASLPSGVNVIDDSPAAVRLHGCVISGDLPQLLELLKTRVNPNERDRTGQAPLHRAAHNLATDITRALLAAKAWALPWVMGIQPNGAITHLSFHVFKFMVYFFTTQYK